MRPYDMRWLSDAVGMVCVTVLAVAGVIPGAWALGGIMTVLGFVAVAKARDQGNPPSGSAPVTEVNHALVKPALIRFPPGGLSLLFSALFVLLALPVEA